MGPLCSLCPTTGGNIHLITQGAVQFAPLPVFTKFIFDSLISKWTVLEEWRPWEIISLGGESPMNGISVLMKRIQNRLYASSPM